VVIRGLTARGNGAVTMTSPLTKIKSLFADDRRPAHFTDHTHCEECAAHDATLQAYDRRELPAEAVLNPGWDPICFVTPAGFRYLFPRLCTLAYGKGEAFYLELFLRHLENNLHLLSGEEKAAVFELLLDLIDRLPEDIALNCTKPDIDRISERLLGKEAN